MGMNTTQNAKNLAAKNTAEVVSRKYHEARAVGATDDQAIEAVRALWLGYLLDISAA